MGAHREANSPPKRRRDPKGRRRRSQVRTSRKKSFIQLIFRQMDFSTLTKPDFAALHCFSKSKIICADASAESRAIHAIWTPQNGGKGEVVFYRGQNYLFYFEQTQFHERKVSRQSKKENIEAKQVDFLSNSPRFSPNPRSFSGKADIRRLPFLFSRFPTCTDRPERTRAHAHRALSEFAFLAFTLHLHPQHTDYQKE